MPVTVELTVEQLVGSIARLSEDERKELDLLLDTEELKRRSDEVRSGHYLSLEEMDSLRDV